MALTFKKTTNYFSHGVGLMLIILIFIWDFKTQNKVAAGASYDGRKASVYARV